MQRPASARENLLASEFSIQQHMIYSETGFAGCSGLHWSYLYNRKNDCETPTLSLAWKVRLQWPVRCRNRHKSFTRTKVFRAYLCMSASLPKAIILLKAIIPCKGKVPHPMSQLETQHTKWPVWSNVHSGATPVTLKQMPHIINQLSLSKAYLAPL